MKKTQCIIFVLKNDEKFLLENLENILSLKKGFDLYFVVRESNDRTNQLLKANQLLNIELTYDPGYYEAIRTGFVFIKNFNYESVVEFGECGSIDINEIQRLININEDYRRRKPIIFASKYLSPQKQTKIKKYVKLTINLRVYDPYTRFKIYNKSAFELLRKYFDFKLNTQDFLNMLYRCKEFIEVKTKSMKKKEHFNERLKKWTEKFRVFIFCFFILSFTKRFGYKLENE